MRSFHASSGERVCRTSTNTHSTICARDDRGHRTRKVHSGLASSSPRESCDIRFLWRSVSDWISISLTLTAFRQHCLKVLHQLPAVDIAVEVAFGCDSGRKSCKWAPCRPASCRCSVPQSRQLSAATPPISLARTRSRRPGRGYATPNAAASNAVRVAYRTSSNSVGPCSLWSLSSHRAAQCCPSRQPAGNSQIAWGCRPADSGLLPAVMTGVPAPCAAPSDPQYRGIWRKFNWPCIHSVQKVGLGHGKDSTPTTLVGSCDGFSTLHCDPPFGDTRTV